MNFHPTDAQSPISCAAFQTLERPAQPSSTQFVLGFQDGSLTMYRLLLPPLPKRQHGSHSHQSLAFRLQPVKIGAIRKLHKAVMGGTTAVEFVPGYNSRVISIGRDGRCRLIDLQGSGIVLRTWHVSGPATCLSVVTKGSTASDGHKDHTFYFGGDGTEDTHQAHEGSEVLIAIGTEAGKVLVFNILGLLLHEVLMSVPIVNLEWVGKSSTTSVGPNYTSSTPAGPCRVTQEPFEDFEALCNNPDTVKKKISTYMRIGIQRPIPAKSARDLFFKDHLGQISHVPSPRMSAITLSKGENSRNGLKKKAPSRRRIVTETYKSPIYFSSPPSFATGVADSHTHLTPPLQEACTWTRESQVPYVPAPSCANRSFAASSSSLSSQNSGIDDQEFFTPPSTRRQKDVKPQCLVSSCVTDFAATEIQARRPREVHNFPSTLKSLSTGLHPHSKSQMSKTAPRVDRDDTSASLIFTASMPETPQQQVVADEQEPLSQFSSPNSLSSITKPRMVKSPFSKNQIAERESVGVRGTGTRNPQCMTVDTITVPPSLHTASSLYSRSLSHTSRSIPSRVESEVNIQVPRDSSAGASSIGLSNTERMDGQSSQDGRSGQVVTSDDAICRLRRDNQALRKDMETLREEFRLLKGVLLGSKTR